MATFAPDAYVNDNHREIWGTEAIRKFMARDMVRALRAAIRRCMPAGQLAHPGLGGASSRPASSPRLRTPALSKIDFMWSFTAGREGGTEGLQEYLETRYAAFGGQTGAATTA